MTPARLVLWAWVCAVAIALAQHKIPILEHFQQLQYVLSSSTQPTNQPPQ